MESAQERKARYSLGDSRKDGLWTEYEAIVRSTGERCTYRVAIVKYATEPARCSLLQTVKLLKAFSDQHSDICDPTARLKDTWFDRQTTELVVVTEHVEKFDISKPLLAGSAKIREAIERLLKLVACVHSFGFVLRTVSPACFRIVSATSRIVLFDLSFIEKLPSESALAARKLHGEMNGLSNLMLQIATGSNTCPTTRFSTLKKLYHAMAKSITDPELRAFIKQCGPKSTADHSHTSVETWPSVEELLSDPYWDVHSDSEMSLESDAPRLSSSKSIHWAPADSLVNEINVENEPLMEETEKTLMASNFQKQISGGSPSENQILGEINPHDFFMALSMRSRAMSSPFPDEVSRRSSLTHGDGKKQRGNCRRLPHEFLISTT